MQWLFKRFMRDKPQTKREPDDYVIRNVIAALESGRFQLRKPCLLSYELDVDYGGRVVVEMSIALVNGEVRLTYILSRERLFSWDIVYYVTNSPVSDERIVRLAKGLMS